MSLTIDTSIILEQPIVTPVQAIKRIIDELCANPSEDEPRIDVVTLTRHLEALRELYKCEVIDDLPGPIGFVVDESRRAGDSLVLDCGDYMNVLFLQQRRELARAA